MKYTKIGSAAGHSRCVEREAGRYRETSSRNVNLSRYFGRAVTLFCLCVCFFLVFLQPFLPAILDEFSHAEIYFDDDDSDEN